MEKVIVKQTRFNACADIQAKGTGTFANGEISGFAALWDVRDLDGDVIRKGAFGRSISNQIASGTVPLMIRHIKSGGDAAETIGIIKEAREDDLGFWVRAELFGTEAAQDMRIKAMKAPQMFGMSVGWRDVEGGKRVLSDGQGFEFTEMSLKEVTITIIPAQEQTIGTLRGKSGSLIEELEQMKSEIVTLREQLCALQSKEGDVEGAEQAIEEPAEDAASDVAEVPVPEIADIEELEMRLALLETEDE